MSPIFLYKTGIPGLIRTSTFISNLFSAELAIYCLKHVRRWGQLDQELADVSSAVNFSSFSAKSDFFFPLQV
jgi:hypothetical protein